RSAGICASRLAVPGRRSGRRSAARSITARLAVSTSLTTSGGRWSTTCLGADGRAYHNRWSGLVPVSGLYVHPRTHLHCYAPESWRGCRGGPFLKPQAALRAFGIDASTAADIRGYRVDDVRVWEHRDCGWFIHTYHHVPEKLVRVLTRSD